MVSPYDKQYEEKARKFLEIEGFEQIRRPENAVYDFEAVRDGKICLIEVRVRTPKAKTQFFTIRDTKIRHLLDAQNSRNATVYLFLVNKYGYKLITLNQLLKDKFPDIKVFKYAKRSTTPSFITDKREKSLKDEWIRFRCKRSTKIMFKKFMIDYNFKNCEDALIDLLAHYVPRKII